MTCLRKICHQIGASSDLFEAKSIFLPHDKNIEKAASTIQAIEEAKARMARLMDGYRIFFVLDDVWSHEDVELFNFGDLISSPFVLIITTRTLDMFPSPGALCIEIPFMAPIDALKFFFIEYDRDDLPSEEKYTLATKIVQKCGYLPLAIRIAAKISQACPGFLHSENLIEKNPNEYGTDDQLKHLSKEIAANQAVTDLLDRSFSFVTESGASYAVKICFSALAVVFHHDNDLRPWVSQNIVEKFWVRLFVSSDDLKSFLPQTLKYRLWGRITHILRVMGLINEQTKQDEGHSQIQIHHDLLWEYGKMVAIKFGEKKRDTNSSDHVFTDNEHSDSDGRTHKRRGTDGGGNNCSTDGVSSSLRRYTNTNYQDVEVKWNNFMVDCYQEKIDLVMKDSDCDPYLTCDGHMLRWLPYHMIKAQKMDEALDLMMTKSFLQDRIAFLGTFEGTKQYGSDLEALNKAETLRNPVWNSKLKQHGNMANGLKLKSIALLFMIEQSLSEMLQVLSPKSKFEIANAYIFLGTLEQKFSLWIESFNCYRRALAIFQLLGLDENHPSFFTTVEHLDCCSVMPLFTYSFHNIQVLLPESSPCCIRLKYAKQLLKYDYGPEGLPLDLISHPGKGICRHSDFFGDQTQCWKKFGLSFTAVAPNEASVRVIRHGKYLQCAASDEILSFYGPANPGTTVVLSSAGEGREKGEWILKKDGRISFTQAPHLCMAMSPTTFCVLVHKDSSNKLIFENSAELKKLIYNKNSENRKGVPLSFSSHPNFGLTPNKEFSIMEVGPSKLMLLHIGPAKEAVEARFSENQEIVLDDYGGMVFRANANILDNHNVVNATLDARPGQQFQVNDEGSISPVKAPHLVLGIPEVGFSNEEANRIKSEAKKMAADLYGLSSNRILNGTSCSGEEEQVHDVDGETELFHELMAKYIK
mmetsp:Transcript_41910/g.98227  ORF Transcript_41910/g.98227 Transcript_41910/m.98227 type:complete len:924 (-) Transcript_41910:108-2879(-)